MTDTKFETIQTLKAADSKRITCSYSCGKQAQLCETVRLYTGSLAFYYYCHECWKAKELSNIKSDRSLTDTSV